MTLHLRLLFMFILFAAGGSLYAQIGIGTQTPNDNAALEIKSPDKGLLIPRIELTNATTFLGGGSGAAGDNGMFVYHTGSTSMEKGLYVWQWETSSGKWVKFATGTSIDDGSTDNATLRWDSSSSKWVENTNLTSNSSGNTAVKGTLDVTGATTFTGAVTASSTLTVSGLLTASNGLTVTNGAVDLGSGGVTVGGTSTLNGNVTLGSSATLTVTNGAVDLGSGDVDLGTGAVTADGNLTVGGTSTLTGNVTASGTLAVTGASTLTGKVTASGGVDITGDTKLSGKLTGSDGTAGTDGQILTAKSDGTIQWTTPEAAPTVSTVDATGSVAATVGTLIINANATPADITMTLPTGVEEGHTIRIRRNFDYTGTSDSVKIAAGTSQTINGQSAKNLNVGFQSVTLVYIGSNSWVSID